MPRKLGQHFLTNPSILEQIASAACGEQTPRIVEIGPGRGALTRHLLPRTGELHAIELDSSLIPALQRQFSGHANFHLHHADVLATDVSQWGPSVIVGNLPYYITSPILERFLALDASFERAVFLVQEEVAERLRASPGSRDYGFFSVKTQLICRVDVLKRVPPGAFSPPPKVSSAVVRLIRHSVMNEDNAELLRFVGRCFAQKRKTLRNNLKGFYPGQLVDALPEASLRAEQLSIERLKDLHWRLSSYSRTMPMSQV